MKVEYGQIDKQTHTWSTDFNKDAKTSEEKDRARIMNQITIWKNMSCNLTYHCTQI